MSGSPCDEGSSLTDWLSYIEGLHTQVIDMSLGRVQRVANDMDVAKPASFTFLVGGTNGKGTTCHAIEQTLIHSGHRVGVFSSPQFLDYRDTVRIQGCVPSEPQFAEAFASIERMRKSVTLTAFEFNTLAALHIMKTEKVDVAVVEVGMGGRDDATNVVDADLSIITNVAIDHEAWLGRDRESIGSIKAGIFRAERDVVIGEAHPPASVRTKAVELGSLIHQRGIDWDLSVNDDGWRYQDPFGAIEALPLPLMPVENVATALAALRTSGLPIHFDAIERMIRTDNLPGRFQVFDGRPTVILDVAHNPHGAAYLAKGLAGFRARGRILFVIGILIDKDIAGIVEALRPLANGWYCCGTLAGSRSSSARDIAQYVKGANLYDNIVDGWQAAVADADQNDTVVVCGSFVSVAPVLHKLRQQAPPS